MPTRSFACVDVETSGLSPAGDRVLSVGVVLLDPDFSVSSSWSSLLDPGVDPGPVHVHGLTRERLQGAPGFDAVAPTLLELLADRVVVAHNAPFDVGFLTAELRRASLPSPALDVLDTLELARGALPRLRDRSLGSLASHLSVVPGAPHDALGDAETLSRLLPRLCALVPSWPELLVPWSQARQRRRPVRGRVTPPAATGPLVGSWVGLVGSGSALEVVRSRVAELGGTVASLRVEVDFDVLGSGDLFALVAAPGSESSPLVDLARSRGVRVVSAAELVTELYSLQ